MRVLEPGALELSLSAAGQIQEERERLHGHWKHRLERAGYEADRAARQYHAVEPENRLVARELERRWDESLQAERRLEEDYHRFQSEQPRDFSSEDQKNHSRLDLGHPRAVGATHHHGGRAADYHQALGREDRRGRAERHGICGCHDPLDGGQ